MRSTGRAIACALLALAILKNALPTAAVNVALSRNERETGPPKVTRLTPVSQGTPVDRDVQDLRLFMDDLLANNDEAPEGNGVEGRTFGHKRVQFMLMPMMYKMGVMMTLLTVLTVISLKGLFVGVVLLILKLSTFMAKFSVGWQQPTPTPGWPAQPIHVHVHNSHPSAHHQAYHAWDSASDLAEDEHYYYKG
ncbi:hypothetical protein KM043_011605 [Ampulex compressa]|nr:hypothetical protein KM043_011605 [Ampulex compressa]